ESPTCQSPADTQGFSFGETSGKHAYTSKIHKFSISVFHNLILFEHMCVCVLTAVAPDRVSGVCVCCLQWSQTESVVCVCVCAVCSGLRVWGVCVCAVFRELSQSLWCECST